MEIALTCHFDRGYIADPYWPARERLINIQKESGMNRARSTANRRKALEEHLKGIGMTVADYEKLEAEAARPFYTLDGTTEIVIPDHHVYGFLVATMDTIRAAGKACPPDQVRVRLEASAWRTGKKKADGIWERFAVVSGGTGQKLSNQRALRRNAYIEHFDTRGTIGIDPGFVKPEALEKALKWGAANVGVGACRKMGWGRFTVETFQVK